MHKCYSSKLLKGLSLSLVFMLFGEELVAQQTKRIQIKPLEEVTLVTYRTRRTDTQCSCQEQKAKTTIGGKLSGTIRVFGIELSANTEVEHVIGCTGSCRTLTLTRVWTVNTKTNRNVSDVTHRDYGNDRACQLVSGSNIISNSCEKSRQGNWSKRY